MRQVRIRASREPLYLVSALGLFVSLALSPALSADDSELLTVLKQGYLNTQETRSDISFVYDQLIRTDMYGAPKRDDAAADPVLHIRSSYTRRGLCERVETGITDSGARSFSVSDGQYLLKFSSTQGSVDTETQVGRAVRKPFAGGLLESGYGPTRLFGYAGVMPDDVLYSAQAVVDGAPYELNGIMCYKVTSPLPINGVTYSISYWFSPERSGLPVRFELREDEGRFYKTIEVEEFVQLEDGSWFPKRTLFRAFSTIDGQMREVNHNTYVAEDIVLHPTDLDESFFSTSNDALPAGTILVDALTQMEFTVGEGPISQERLDRYIAQAIEQLPELSAENEVAPVHDTPPERPLLADDGIRYREPPRKGGFVWGCLIGALAIAGGAVSVLIRRRQTRDRSQRPVD